MNAARLLTLTALLTSCAPAAPAHDVPLPPSSASAVAPATATAAPAAATSSAPAAERAPEPCGGFDCMMYDSPERALEAVLAERPQVLAVGEAHAQRGSEGIASSTQRFTERLLPLLEERASDLVIELIVADGKCGTEKQVADVQRPVTQGQAKRNKSEFVLLAEAADRRGVRPHVLRPSCDDYQAVLKAGPDGVGQMLTMIASLTDDMVRRILERNGKAQVDKMVIAYGGAMHNDLAPREGRESWSFGPRLGDHTKGRYVELDVFVPEFIKDTDSWRAFPWYPHYDRARLGHRVVLFKLAEHSYVMIFATTKSVSPADGRRSAGE